MRTNIMDGIDLRLGLRLSSKAIGFSGESIVAEIFENIGIPCQVTGYHHPLDIVPPGLGIEVKTATKIRRIYIGRPERRQKREWCQRNHVHGITVVVRPIEQYMDDDTGEMVEYSEITYKDGFKSFDITRMRDFEEILDEFFGKI